MRSNILIDILCQLDRKEMTRFWEFCYSPYHNKHKDVRHLLDYLDDCFPHFTESNMDREALHNYLFPNKAFDIKVLRHVFNYATKVLESFLTIESLRRDNMGTQLRLLEELRQKGAYNKFNQQLKKSYKIIEARPTRNYEYYHQLFSLDAEADLYFVKQDAYKRDESLQRKVNHLDKFYLSEKLRNACEMLNRALFLNQEFDVAFLDEIIQHISDNYSLYENTPSIIIYHLIYLSITEPENTDRYFQLEQIIEENEQLFPEDERRNIYFYAQNFCIRQINKGNEHFLRVVFELFQKMLENGLLLEKAILSEWHYKNIVTIGLRLKEFDWIHEFIEAYKGQLSPSAKLNAYTYNLASYYQVVGQYDEALQLLHTVEYTDVVYNLDAKTLLLKIYFEMGEEDALMSMIDAFRQYLKRNKLLAKGKYARYYNLLKFTKRTFKLKEEKDFRQDAYIQRELKKLKEKISNANAIANKAWLMRKLEAI